MLRSLEECVNLNDNGDFRRRSNSILYWPRNIGAQEFAESLPTFAAHMMRLYCLIIA